MIKKEKKAKNIFIWLVIMLFLNWPIVNALNFSNIQVSNITENSALVKWSTDSVADSFVDYGTNKSALTSSGDFSNVENHSVTLTGLLNYTTYYYKVKSGTAEDNNSGSLYSFQTLVSTITSSSGTSSTTNLSTTNTSSAITNTTTLPQITATIPTTVGTDKFNLSGTTDTGVQAKLKVNGLSTSTTAVVNKTFQFTNVVLSGDAVNRLEIEVKDIFGNQNTKQFSVYSDVKKPVITLKPVSARINGTAVKLEGTINKNVTFEILVNNRSAYKAQTNNFSQSVTLSDGKNDIDLTATDVGGRKNTLSLQVASDTKPPTIKATLAGGNTYYEGRAKSDITGVTKPGAKVYLYVFPREVYSRTPDFSKAWEMVTADKDGKFTFSGVNFEGVHISLKDLKPREIPASLKDVVLPAIEVIQGQTQKAQEAYIIAEDLMGRVSTSAWTQVITIYNCYSASYAFQIDPLVAYQLPYRLQPVLLDDGRQTISSLIKLKYVGSGVAAKEGEQAFRMAYNPQFQKACTPGMMKEGDFNLSCKIFPQIKLQGGPDGTAWFLQGTLGRTSELTKRDSNLWDDFQKRQLQFPFKVTLGFQERQADGTWSETKTQTSCINLGYFVDIPLESKDLLPGPIVDGAIVALNETTAAIDLILPYIEKAMLVVGIGCGISIIARLATQIYRKFISKFEPYLDKNEEEAKKCVNPDDLFLESTIKSFEKVNPKPANFPKDYKNKKLEDKCSMTASAWKVESTLNTALRWTCDRYFCHKSPAPWTEDQSEPTIIKAKLKEQSCSDYVGKGVPLQELKDCKGYIDNNPTKFNTLTTSTGSSVTSTISDFGGNTCYTDGKDNIYYVEMTDQQKSDAKTTGLYYLTRIGNKFGNAIGNIDYSKDKLVAYQPKGGKGFITSRDITCASLCQEREGYEIAKCYPIDSKTEKTKEEIKPNMYMADYTTDCFPKAPGAAGAKAFTTTSVVKSTSGTTPTPATTTTPSPTELSICVCKTKEKEQPKDSKEAPVKEEWSYRQAQLFSESGGDTKTCGGGKVGRCYPEWRYYSGRDLSAAFGLNHVLDTGKTEKTITEINPFTSHLAAFQTLCLSGIYNRLKLLNSVLKGMQNCLYEAKYTGIQNAGTCKELFSQAVCGLVYKLFAYASKGCLPIPFLEVGKEKDPSTLEAGIGFGFEAVTDALDTSMNDLKQEYGNAKLNDMFKAGTQGVIRNVCLAAFGYDWPYGMDFLTDAAYSVSMKTSALIVPASRELVSYDPIQGAPTYSYQIGANIFPGCKIRKYEVKLKCVTRADLGKENVECSTAADCPCLNINGKYPEMEHSLFTDVKGVTAGSYLSVPLKSPIVVPKPYTYDHVVLEIELDSSEEIKNCFESTHIEGNKGVFYAPITDVSGKPLVACQSDSTTGRFSCPTLSNLFNTFGTTNLQSPYVECYNKRTSKWVDCDGATSYDYFIEGDQIVIRPTIYSDGKKQCLKVQLTGMAAPMILPIEASSVPRTITPEIGLMTVTSSLLGSTTGSNVISSGDCGTYSVSSIGGNAGYPQVGFSLEQDSFKKLILMVNNKQAIKLGTGFTYDTTTTNKIIKIDGTDLTLSDLAQFSFDFNGQRITNPISTTFTSGKTKNTCTYQLQSSSQYSGSSIKTLDLNIELRHPIKDSCSDTTTLLKTTFGKSSHTEKIKIQKTTGAGVPGSLVGVGGTTSTFYADWKIGDYTTVISKAEAVLAQSTANKKYELLDAVAMYYRVAASIMIKDTTNAGSYSDLFFTRNSNYGTAVTSTAEYQKIAAYLGEVRKTYGSNTGTSTT